MKTIFFLAFAIFFVVTTNGNPIETENQVGFGLTKCDQVKIGTSYKKDCNTCRCASNGYEACTRMKCTPVDDSTDDDNENRKKRETKEEEQEPIIAKTMDDACHPGKKYKVDCNTCGCTKKGKLACTRKMCVPTPNPDASTDNDNGNKQKRETKEEEQEPIIAKTMDDACHPGKKYKVDCNTCGCTEKGKLACTRKMCVPTPNPDDLVDSTNENKQKRNTENSPEYKQGEPCEPRKNFKSRCNSCKCGTDGRSAACNFMDCSAFSFENKFPQFVERIENSRVNRNKNFQ